MEEVLLRFDHLAKQVFEISDNETLTRCREVGRSWKNLIDYEDIPWIRITPSSPIEGFEDWNLPMIRDFILSMSRARIKHQSFLALVYPDGEVIPFASPRFLDLPPPLIPFHGHTLWS